MEGHSQYYCQDVVRPTRLSTMQCVVLVIIIISSFLTLIAIRNFQNTKLIALFIVPAEASVGPGAGINEKVIWRL